MVEDTILALLYHNLDIFFSSKDIQFFPWRRYTNHYYFQKKFQSVFWIYTVGDGMRSKSAQKSANFKVNNSKVKDSVMNCVVEIFVPHTTRLNLAPLLYTFCHVWLHRNINKVMIKRDYCIDDHLVILSSTKAKTTAMIDKRQNKADPIRVMYYTNCIIYFIIN